jgi:succinate-acetate transporter protein
MAHWFGSAQSTLLFLPFAAVFGGLAQFLAGMWAFKARDGVATAVHGMWGSFWMAFGLIELILMRGGAAPLYAMFGAMGYWFIVLAAITWVCMIAAAAENTAMTVVLAFLGAASTVGAVGLLMGNTPLVQIAGYLFVGAAVSAWYAASALMLREAFGREVWSLGRGPRRVQLPRVMVGAEPGVIHGQA